MELQGYGIIEYNPLFSSFEEWDYSYNSNSPCIDAGDPEKLDSDGSISDIGAFRYNLETIPGDCNSDSLQNILDVVYLINDCILLNSNECSCGDLNQDNTINVLDVVILVNSILEV